MLALVQEPVKINVSLFCHNVVMFVAAHSLVENWNISMTHEMKQPLITTFSTHCRMTCFKGRSQITCKDERVMDCNNRPYVVFKKCTYMGGNFFSY